MPVQPQYAFGPLGQPASPDGNQIPAQLDGSARYVRSTPPRTFGVSESPTLSSCQHLQPLDSTLQNSPLATMHSLSQRDMFVPSRKTPDGYFFLDPDDVSNATRRDCSNVSAATPPGVLFEGRDRPEIATKYSCLSDVGSIHLSTTNTSAHPHMKSEFHVVNEDFPALPCVPECPREPHQQVPETLPEADLAAAAPAPKQPIGPDNYDLKSLMDRLSSDEFCRVYRILNFEDLHQRNALLHPLAVCAIETVTRDIDVANLQIGVNVANCCTKLREPEDLRNEDPCYRMILGHKISVPENDKYYSMSDQTKDKLRNPRLQMMDDLTLFFQFYFFTRDTVQLVAADALFQRNWRWNKKISRWCRFERAQPSVAVQVGVFQIYDPVACKIQSANLQYSSQDFELYPPVIPPPSLRNADIDYVEKL